MFEEQSDCHVSLPNSSLIQLSKTQCTLHPAPPVWEAQVSLRDRHHQLYCFEIVISIYLIRS